MTLEGPGLGDMLGARFEGSQDFPCPAELGLILREER